MHPPDRIGTVLLNRGQLGDDRPAIDTDLTQGTLTFTVSNGGVQGVDALAMGPCNDSPAFIQIQLAAGVGNAILQTELRRSQGEFHALTACLSAVATACCAAWVRSG